MLLLGVEGQRKLVKKRSCARSLASGRSRGGTDGRRGSTCHVEDPRVQTRSAGEGSPAARGVGARRDQADGRGRGLTGHEREVATPFLSLGFV